MHEYSLASKQL